MIEKANVKDIYSLSPMQEGMLFHWLIERDTGVYFEQTDITVKGQLDEKRILFLFSQLVHRHDVLRTLFVYENIKKPRQVVLKKVEPDFTFIDLSRWEDVKNKVQIQKTNDSLRGFSLDKELPLRLAVLKTADDEYHFVWSFHHIIMDGWCLSTLFREFMELVRADQECRPVVLPEITQYGKYIEWLERQDRDGAREYWRNYLGGYENVMSIPDTGTQSERTGKEYNEGIWVIEQNISAALDSLAQAHNVTINTLMQCAWGILLHKYNRTDDVAFGYVTSGRSAEIDGIEGMIGLCINTIPLRIRISKEEKISELIQAVRKDSRDAEKYEYLALKDIQSETSVKKDLVNHLYVFENFPVLSGLLGNMGDGLKGFAVTGIEATEKTNYDFAINIYKSGTLSFKIEYGKRFSADDVSNIAGHFQQVLRCMTSDVNRLVSEISIITDSERDRILSSFNDTTTNYPSDKTVVDLFESAVDAWPDRTAILSDGRQITYAELNARVNKVARRLREADLGREDRVGILTDRSIEMIVGIFAIIKAGGAYVPFDPEYPDERLSHVFQDADISIIVTQQKHLERVARFGIKNVLDLDNGALYEGDDSNLQKTARPEDLVYTFFTSGTTGKPKGVMIEHRNLVHQINAILRFYEISEQDRFLQFASYSFDMSVEEIFPTLLSGAMLVLIDQSWQAEGRIFWELCERNRVSLANLPTRFWKLVTEDLEVKIPECIRLVAIGGEAVDPVAVGKWLSRMEPLPRLVNAYGPTEVTVNATMKEYSSKNANYNSIGFPMANTKAYILDEANHLMPEGVAGELCIGGSGVSRGYMNRPELTDTKFVFDPFANGKKMYRTGDLARWLSDGSIEFLGRIDDQVKIRGFRIELGEIEVALNKFPGITNSIVLARADSGGDKYLCAYFLGSNGIDANEIREYLEKIVPEYMIPAYFVHIDRIPVNVNGKLDRKLLPEPTGMMLRSSEYLAPSTEEERAIVAVWQEILCVESVGVRDNFFHMGGDSIKAIQVCSALNRANLYIQVRDILEHPRINELATLLKHTRQSISQEPVSGDFDLLPIQRLFFSQNSTNPNHENHSFMLFKEDRFDTDSLQKTIGVLVGRHDVFRSVFFREINEWRQRILPIEECPDVPFSYQDVEDEKDWKLVIQRVVTELQDGFDVREKYLARFHLFRAPDGDHFFLTVHHLIIDGVSWRIFFEDLYSVYSQFLAGDVPSLPRRTSSIGDWIDALKEYRKRQDYPAIEGYWIETKKAPDLIFPCVETENDWYVDNADVRVSLDLGTTEALLKDVHKAYNTQINDILLASAVHTLFEFAGDRGCVKIHLEGHGREPISEKIDLSHTIGWFTTLFPVRFTASREDDIGVLIKKVKEDLRKVPDKGIGYGLAVMLESENTKPSLVFNYLGQIEKMPGDIRESCLGTGPVCAPDSERAAVISVNAMVKDGILEFILSYNKRKMSASFIDELGNRLVESCRILVSYCLGTGEKQLTPSDFTYSTLGFEELENLYSTIEGVFEGDLS